MDASLHMAGVVRDREDAAQAPSRPIPTRSQTQSDTKNLGQSTDSLNEIDFGIPDVRPGLARLGRRLTEMSENFLYDENRSSPNTKRGSSSSGRASFDMAAKVPFMGDEPVFCPFCNKPLPPALLLQHMTAVADEVEKADKQAVNKPMTNPRLSGVGAESAGMAKSSSAPATPTKLPSSTPVKPELQHKPSGLSSSRPVSPTTSGQLEKPVKEAESVDSAASKVTVHNDTLRKWARIAGVRLDLPQSESEKQSTPAEPTKAKPFPKIAPPPEDRSRPSSRNSSRFSLFGGKPKGKQDEDEEEDSDDDMGGPGGYAKLDAPASPDREEKELPQLTRRSTDRHVNGDSTWSAEAKEGTRPAEPEPASEEEVRSLLKEVLAKVAEMSKSHESVLHSHSTLLTTLKIARSNLAMAEANAEMLEEKLKRPGIAPKPAPATATAPRTPSSTSMGPPATPVSRPMPARTVTTAPGAGEGSMTKTEPAAPRRSAESARPQSIQIPQSTNPRSPMAESADSSKGMFGSFWNRNKDKVGEFMNSLPDLTPVAEKSSFDFGKSPSTGFVPYGAPMPDQYRSPGLNRSKTVHGRVGEGQGESLNRSASSTNVSAASSSSVPSDPYTRELSRLRKLHQSSQSKIESMTKELADLKKGKIEMEAELENLSQALFEEANKMVSDEKKKRAELEESLKEVKEEREALRQTIKVLGGQVEDMSNSSRGDPDEEKDDLADLPEFQPRDLDKHYEALRKSIHHVADGAAVNEWNAANANSGQEVPGTPAESEFSKTPNQPRRHSLPDISSPEASRGPALHDPWAESGPSTPATDNTDNSSPVRAKKHIPGLTMTENVGPKDSALGLQTESSPSEDRSPKSASPSPLSEKEQKEEPTSTPPEIKSDPEESPKAGKLDALDKMMKEMHTDVVVDSPIREKANPFG